MVPDFVRLGFTSEILLPNQGFLARFLDPTYRAAGIRPLVRAGGPSDKTYERSAAQG